MIDSIQIKKYSNSNYLKDIVIEAQSNTGFANGPLQQALDIIPLTGIGLKLAKKTTLGIKNACLVDEFKKIQPDSTLHKVSIHAIRVSATVGGSMTGAILGSIPGVVLLNPPLAVGGGIAGSFIGGGIGYGLSHLGTNIYTLSKTKSSSLYECFYKEVTKEVIEGYKELIVRHPGIFKEYICPISNSFAIIPVKYPGLNFTFDQQSILKYIKDSTGKTLSFDITNFDKNKLYYDYDYIPNLMNRLYDFSQKSFDIKMDLAISTLDYFDKNRTKTINSMLLELSGNLSEEIITLKQYKAGVDYLTKALEKSEKLDKKLKYQAKKKALEMKKQEKSQVRDKITVANEILDMVCGFKRSEKK